MQKRLTGLIPASFTPMKADGGIDLGVIDRYADYYLKEKLAAVFVNGSSGESLSLSTPERMAIAERWVKASAGRLTVIVHVGGPCIEDCKALAAHAQKIGASAISSMAPNFFPVESIDHLADFCAQAASAAPKLDYYYYHIPVRTGVVFPMAAFLPAAAKKIPTLAGCKYTYETLDDYTRCLHIDGGRFNMLYGRDEMFLAGLAMGATGAVGTTYNYSAPLYHKLIAAFEKGDIVEARKQQLRSIEFISALRTYGFPGFKAVMKMVGLDCGSVRPPLRPLTDEQYRTLQDTLTKMGYFEWRK